MPPLGQTALVLLIPEAEPALGLIASDHPCLVRSGVPAHVTVLYPWIPVGEIDSAALSRCSSLAASAEPADVSFSSVHVHPGMIFLEPDQREVVDRLIKGAEASWPSLRPYGGKYPGNPPHVSLALGAMEDDEIEAVRTLIEPVLPIRSRFDELQLVAFDENGWTVRKRWRFSTGSEVNGRR